jgi:hypothetical protein
VKRNGPLTMGGLKDKVLPEIVTQVGWLVSFAITVDP